MGSGDLDIYIVVSLFLGFKITAMTIFFSFYFWGFNRSFTYSFKEKE